MQSHAIHLNEISAKLGSMTQELANKCDDREIKKIQEQLPRFALYDDYKGLYNRVVPPVGNFQIQMESFSTQIT